MYQTYPPPLFDPFAHLGKTNRTMFPLELDTLLVDIASFWQPTSPTDDEHRYHLLLRELVRLTASDFFEAFAYLTPAIHRVFGSACAHDMVGAIRHLTDTA
jgi:hypothetical protein